MEGARVVARRGSPALALALFGAGSAAAVLAGAWVAAVSGVPASVWGRDLAAWVVGAGVAAGLSRAPASVVRAVALAPIGAALLLAAAFLDRGQEGVHRWIALGGFRLNAGELVLPAAAVVWAARGGRISGAALLAAGLLLAAQPDSSQSAALALAVACALAARGRTSRLEVGLAVALLVLFGLALTRPDPLAPVPEVEGVFRLAWSAAPPAALAAGLALAAAVFAPVLVLRDAAPSTRAAAAAFAGALGAAALAPTLGAYPVPLVGVGISPILGAWLGVGVLAAQARAEREAGR